MKQRGAGDSGCARLRTRKLAAAGAAGSAAGAQALATGMPGGAPPEHTACKVGGVGRRRHLEYAKHQVAHERGVGALLPFLGPAQHLKNAPGRHQLRTASGGGWVGRWVGGMAGWGVGGGVKEVEVNGVWCGVAGREGLGNGMAEGCPPGAQLLEQPCQPRSRG